METCLNEVLKVNWNVPFNQGEIGEWGIEDKPVLFLSLLLENATYIYVNPPCRTSIFSFLREEREIRRIQVQDYKQKIISLKRLGNPKGKKNT